MPERAAPPPLPRPHNLDEVYGLILAISQRVDGLSQRMDVIVNGQLEMSGQIGRIVAAISGVELAIANLRSAFEPIRARTASAHELEQVAERIERKAEDIIEAAEEITSPGVVKTTSDPVRDMIKRVRGEEALANQEREAADRRAIKRQVIGGVILAILLAILAFFTGRGIK